MFLPQLPELLADCRSTNLLGIVDVRALTVPLLSWITALPIARIIALPNFSQRCVSTWSCTPAKPPWSAAGMAPIGIELLSGEMMRVMTIGMRVCPLVTTLS
jgi:hypothetical protein